MLLLCNEFRWQEEGWRSGSVGHTEAEPRPRSLPPFGCPGTCVLPLVQRGDQRTRVSTPGRSWGSSAVDVLADDRGDQQVQEGDVVGGGDVVDDRIEHGGGI